VAIAIPKNAILSNKNKNDISCGDFIFLLFFILRAIIAAIKKMMPVMKRKSVILIAVLITAVLLSACDLIRLRNPISDEAFASTMELLGYTIEDITDSMDVNTGVSLIAVDSTGSYQIEFYYFETTTQANSAFSHMRTFIENIGGGGGTASVDARNWASFSRTVAGDYCYVYRVDTSVVFVHAPSEFRDEIRDAMSELREAVS